MALYIDGKNMSNKHTGMLLSLLGTLIISTDTLLIRIIQANDILQIVFWRGLFMFLSATIACLVFPRLKTSFLSSAVRVDFWLTSACYAISAILFIVSLNGSAVANTLFIISATPLFSAVLSRLILKEATPTATWVAMGVALCGIGLVLYAGLDSAQLVWNGLAALSALAMGGALVISRKSGSNMALAPTLGGLISALAVLPFISQPGFQQARQWGWGLLEGGLVMPLSLSLIALSPRFIPAPHVAMFLLLESILGPVWVWAALGETPSRWAWAGGAIVITALLAHSTMLLTASQAHPQPTSQRIVVPRKL